MLEQKAIFPTKIRRGTSWSFEQSTESPDSNTKSPRQNYLMRWRGINKPYEIINQIFAKRIQSSKDRFFHRFLPAKFLQKGSREAHHQANCSSLRLDPPAAAFLSSDSRVRTRRNRERWRKGIVFSPLGSIAMHSPSSTDRLPSNRPSPNATAPRHADPTHGLSQLSNCICSAMKNNYIYIF